MNHHLVGEESWIIEPLLSAELARTADLAYRTGRRYQASSMSSRAVSCGGRCPKRWASVAASPAGGALVIGKERACGGACTAPCLTDSDDQEASSGRGPAWIRRAYRRKEERRGGPESNRRNSGSKRHLVPDPNGVPRAVVLSSANVHGSTVLDELVDAVEPVRGPVKGRHRRRPAKGHADEGYDFPRCRRALRERGIVAPIGWLGTDTSERLGRYRWVVGRTPA
jgi:hypothetical protein